MLYGNINRNIKSINFVTICLVWFNYALILQLSLYRGATIKEGSFLRMCCVQSLVLSEWLSVLV